MALLGLGRLEREVFEAAVAHGLRTKRAAARGATAGGARRYTAPELGRQLGVTHPAQRVGEVLRFALGHGLMPSVPIAISSASSAQPA